MPVHDFSAADLFTGVPCERHRLYDHLIKCREDAGDLHRLTASNALPFTSHMGIFARAGAHCTISNVSLHEVAKKDPRPLTLSNFGMWLMFEPWLPESTKTAEEMEDICLTHIRVCVVDPTGAEGAYVAMRVVCFGTGRVIDLPGERSVTVRDPMHSHVHAVLSPTARSYLMGMVRAGDTWQEGDPRMTRTVRFECVAEHRP